MPEMNSTGGALIHAPGTNSEMASVSLRWALWSPKRKQSCAHTLLRLRVIQTGRIRKR